MATCVSNISDTLGFASCVNFGSKHILTSSVRQTHGKMEHILSCYERGIIFLHFTTHNAIKLIHLVCTYSPELWQSPSSRQFHWKDQFRQTPKHLYGYLTKPTCLRIEIKFSLNENNFYSKKFKISFRMNDVIFLLRFSSDQLLYNVEQLLSTEKKLCLLDRAE